MNILKYCLFASLLAFPVAAQESLHLGSVSYAITSDDGEDGELDTDVDTTTFEGEYFVSDNVSLELGFLDHETQYDLHYDNELCQTDKLQLGATYHSMRVDVLAGSGTGYSVGVRTSDESTECKSDVPDEDTTTQDETNEYLDFTYGRGLGNGLSFEASLSTNVDDLFDDRAIGLGLTQTFGSNFGLSGSYVTTETAKDAFGYTQDSTVLKISASYYF
tara:strand:- start:226 stop:879 length:654 start_codon:yes stop_codon:yes gene_type:complete